MHWSCCVDTLVAFKSVVLFGKSNKRPNQIYVTVIIFRRYYGGHACRRLTGIVGSRSEVWKRWHTAWRTTPDRRMVRRCCWRSWNGTRRAEDKTLPPTNSPRQQPLYTPQYITRPLSVVQTGGNYPAGLPRPPPAWVFTSDAAAATDSSGRTTLGSTVNMLCQILGVRDNFKRRFSGLTHHQTYRRDLLSDESLDESTHRRWYCNGAILRITVHQRTTVCLAAAVCGYE